MNEAALKTVKYEVLNFGYSTTGIKENICKGYKTSALYENHVAQSFTRTLGLCNIIYEDRDRSFESVHRHM